MTISHNRLRLRKLKAGWRDTWLLLGEFCYTAFSAAGMAAPAFAAAASGVDMTRPITVEGQAVSLAHLKIEPASLLIS